MVQYIWDGTLVKPPKEAFKRRYTLINTHYYKVYIGLMIKGTIPRLTPFSLMNLRLAAHPMACCFGMFSAFSHQCLHRGGLGRRPLFHGCHQVSRYVEGLGCMLGKRPNGFSTTVCSTFVQHPGAWQLVPEEQHSLSMTYIINQ